MPELLSHGIVSNMRCVFQGNAGGPRRPKGCAEGHKPKPGNTAVVAGTSATAAVSKSSRDRLTRAAGSGEKTLFVVCPDFGTPGEPVEIVGNSQHDRFCRALVHRFRQGTHFRSPLPPMIWVISQHTRHRCWGGGRYSHRWRTVSLIHVNVY